MDGYSYPVSAYTERGRKLYSYRCEICGGIINGYAKMRVKGRITCYSCKREIAKNRYHEEKMEKWKLLKKKKKNEVN